jgi:hypothetical protein
VKAARWLARVGAAVLCWHSMEPNAPSPERQSPDRPAGRAGSPGGSLPWVLLLAAVVVGALLAVFRQRSADNGGEPSTTGAAASVPIRPSPQPTGETASLSIDFGNGVRKQFASLAYRHGMTAGDLMREAHKFRPGLRFTQRGSGAMGFVESLENVANEGGGGRNWLYSVNGQPATKSFDAQTLEPGAAVLWEFRGGE